jgi:transposase
MVRPRQKRYGPVSRIDLDAVRSLVRGKSDIVLRELQAELGNAGVRISIAHMARVLKQMGLHLKKSRSTPASATPKPTAKSAKRSSSGSATSRPKT